MRNLIRLEELFLFLLSISMFAQLGFALLHHKAVAVAAYVVGVFVGSPVFQLAGVIVLGHASLDRVFGYGLKYPDSFKHTHLGQLGASSQP